MPCRAVILTFVSFYLMISFIACAPSDSPQDADTAQSGYVGGGHNIDPESASHLQYIWNVTFKPDEKVNLTAAKNHACGEITTYYSTMLDHWYILLHRASR